MLVWQSGSDVEVPQDLKEDDWCDRGTRGEEDGFRSRLGLRKRTEGVEDCLPSREDVCLDLAS